MDEDEVCPRASEISSNNNNSFRTHRKRKLFEDESSPVVAKKSHIEIGSVESRRKTSRKNSTSYTPEYENFVENGFSLKSSPTRKKCTSCTPEHKNVVQNGSESLKSSPKLYFLRTPQSRTKYESSPEIKSGGDNKRTPKSKTKNHLVCTPQSKGKMPDFVGSDVKKARFSVNALTPTVPARTKILRTPTTPLDRARQMLHASNCPASLPCREREFNEIYKFILCKMDTKNGGCMYISGMPGTGKTATVLRVVHKLENEDDVPEFKFVEINSLRLTEQRQAYCKLWKGISGKSATVKVAQRSLEKHFTSRKRKKDIIVLLIDELEYLCNKRQDVIYNILDWSEKNGSVLIVLTIANTMDLPERTLRGKVTSRVGLTRIVFQPYSYQQLQKIVMDRLSKSKSFHPDAVQLAARKVAAVSGDARRALDICRKAVDIASAKNNDDKSVVTIADVEESVNQIMSFPIVLAIKGCSVMQQLVLRAIRDECMRIGMELCTFDKMLLQFQALCTLEGYEAPNLMQVNTICTGLDECGLIIADKSKNCGIKRKLSLNVSTDDIHYALMRS